MTRKYFGGDEAGHVSFNFDKGATRNFVVVFVSTSTPDELRNRVAQFRRDRNLPSDFEFSFFETTSDTLRMAFFSLLAKSTVAIWALVVDKTRLPDVYRVMRGAEFYIFFVEELVQHIPLAERDGAVLILDEFDRSGKILARLKRSLKERHIERGFKKIIAMRSESEDLIQIADMLAGALLRKYTRGDDSFWKIAQGQVRGLTEFGK